MLKHGRSLQEIAQALTDSCDGIHHHLSAKESRSATEKSRTLFITALDVFEEILAWFQSLGGGNGNEKNSLQKLGWALGVMLLPVLYAVWVIKHYQKT